MTTGIQPDRLRRAAGTALAAVTLASLTACSGSSPTNDPAARAHTDTSVTRSTAGYRNEAAPDGAPGVFAVQAATGRITGLAGQCLDAAGSGDGAPVRIHGCNGTAAQEWTVEPDGTIRALGKCLDVTDGSTADGATVQLWTCTGGAHQKWTVNTAHDIVDPAADKCLDVTDRNPADGTRVQIWSCTGGANQKWTVNTAHDIVDPAADTCLDATDRNPADGTRVWSCTGGGDRKGSAPAGQSGDTCWATHYGPEPAGALTASGELYDGDADTAATSLSRRPQLPFGARVRVTNVANGRSLVVRINDRGTYAWTAQEPKCLDLTDSAFRRLGGRLDPDDGHIVVTEKLLD
ncbi:hypothetical protein GCM10010512_27500 [Streptomyces thermoviolaceus subsp. thermoviolaceus]|uniref:ricin-type beta-trefoil lectin domain protein n=1 Tax=Streptomyces thermoviolaceus TaxID=1952 RepID=UPI0019907822|nr:hypothetical protein GCM10010499_28930 [Streptomyces thermoviolaceus subsp. apingens]GHA94444.1 hypothetical protein GCM10010512_27500 [Streptomyces thermoviolaceus subsp. thermoviolaceus]